MWSLLSKRYQLTIVIASAFLVVAAIEAAYGLALGNEPPIFKLLSLTVTVVGGMLTLVLNKLWPWVWRTFPAIQRSTFPNLNGTWKGDLVPTWVNPATAAIAPPIPVEITIRQNLFATTLTLKSDESTSHSTRSILEAFRETKKFRVWYSYNNDPQAQVRHRSSPHEGVAFLDLDYDADPHKLTGRYYTERKTTGDIVVQRKRPGRPRKR
jgi:SMODS-associating 2TM, beta-strand rich effector domain